MWHVSSHSTAAGCKLPYTVYLLICTGGVDENEDEEEDENNAEEDDIGDDDDYIDNSSNDEVDREEENSAAGNDNGYEMISAEDVENGDRGDVAREDDKDIDGEESRPSVRRRKGKRRIT